MKKQEDFSRLVKKIWKNKRKLGRPKIRIKKDQNDGIIFGCLRQATIYELKSSNEKNENENVVFKTITKEGVGHNTFPEQRSVLINQLLFTCSTSPIETLEKVVKYVQS